MSANGPQRRGFYRDTEHKDQPKEHEVGDAEGPGAPGRPDRLVPLQQIQHKREYLYAARQKRTSCC
jgi:hypothetical protein